MSDLVAAAINTDIEAVINHDSKEKEHFDLMQTELDATHLLAPINETAPCGTDLRTAENWVEAYYTLRDTRNQLRRQEREASANGDLLPVPNFAWQPVIVQATFLLTKASKDIEIMAWLIEALTRHNGFAGLHDGLLLLQKLISVYGTALFPLVETEAADEQFSSLLALSGDYHEGTLIYPLNLAALISTDKEAISYWDYTQAQANQSSPQEDSRNLSDLIALTKKSNAGKNASTAQLLERSLNYIDAIETLINAGQPDSEFNLTGLRQKLKQCLAAQQQLLNLAQKNQAVAQLHPNATLENNFLTEQTAQQTVEHFQLTALEHIEAAHAIFRSEQPHSPITASLARILRWAKQDLDALIPELIPDPQARQLFCLITGANSPVTQQPPFHQQDGFYAEGEDGE